MKTFLIVAMWAAIALSVAVPIWATWRTRTPKRKIGKHPALGMPYASGGFVCCEHDEQCEREGPLCPDFLIARLPRKGEVVFTSRLVPGFPLLMCPINCCDDPRTCPFGPTCERVAKPTLDPEAIYRLWNGVSPVAEVRTMIDAALIYDRWNHPPGVVVKRGRGVFILTAIRHPILAVRTFVVAFRRECRRIKALAR